MTGYLGKLIARAAVQPVRPPGRPIADPFENVGPMLPPLATAPAQNIPARHAPKAPQEPTTPAREVQRTIVEHTERIEPRIEREVLEREVRIPGQATPTEPAAPASPQVTKPAASTLPRAEELPPRQARETEDPVEHIVPAPPPAEHTIIREVERTVDLTTERMISEIQPQQVIESTIHYERSRDAERALPFPVATPQIREIERPMATPPEEPRLSIGRLLVDVVPTPAAVPVAPSRAIRRTRTRFERAPNTRFGLGQM